MTKAINNYDKTKISMAHVFLQYDQATMIHKYSLDYNSDWLYITFINRTYRINRKTGSVQWADNDFETIHEANHNEAMTIYDVLCYSKDRCHLSHEFVNINSLSSIRTGNLSQNSEFFQNTAEFGIKNGQSELDDVWRMLLNYIKLGYLCLLIQDM